MSGTTGPRILVKREITKNVRKTRITAKRLLAITSSLLDDFPEGNSQSHCAN